MRFKSLEIKRDTEWKNGKRQEVVKGRINFDTDDENNWISLKLDEEAIKDMIVLCTPLFEKVHSEKMQAIYDEFKGE